MPKTQQANPESFQQLPVSPEATLSQEIATQVDLLRDFAGANGKEFCPPILALGISERVGSNWFLDTLSNTLHTHNEPFRQQLHATHPMSTIFSRPTNAADYRVPEMHPYEKYWLTNFVTSKYGNQPQLVKETNLFFATQNLLDLFPDSRTIVLARNPIGIASSFAGGKLFSRWNYDERYNQLKAMTREPQYSEYQFVFDGEHDPGSLRKLTRLVVLNTLLVSNSLADRQRMVVRYEDSVIGRQATLQRLSQFLLSDGVEVADDKAINEDTATDHDFSTRKQKTTLEVQLDTDDIRTVQTEVRRLLADSLSVLSQAQYTEVQALLEHHTHQYTPRGRKSLTPEKTRTKELTERPLINFVTIPEQGLEWLNQPVNNDDFVDFLNAMHAEGLPNVIHGVQLFVNENMIPERGGRIWFNPNKSKYEVTEGYENHPVYWVTWLGAAAYARFIGCRLPDRDEIEELTQLVLEDIDLNKINAGHAHHDASPIGAMSPNRMGIYDLIGNIASWCRDGNPHDEISAASRYMFGTSWNRDATIEELQRIKSRPVSGCSRSVGIRLVRDEAKALSAEEIAVRLEGWFDLLSESLDQSRVDRYIIDQLTY